MNERWEELASLRALDLLESDELSQFEAELARTPSLQTLVRELRDTSSALAFTAPVVTPPAALKSRILAALPPAGRPDNIIRPSPRMFRALMPWAIAAGLALGTGWLAQLYFGSRSEADLFRNQAALAEISHQSSRQQLEAERIIAKQQLTTLQQQVTSTAAQLAESRGQVARLTNDLKTQGDLASLKITALASMLNNSPKAIAVAVWDPAKQEGVLKVEQLPALLPNQDYQLWVVDPQYPNPVDGGVFTVDAQTGAARMPFKARQPVGAVSAFAVTLERKGGVPKAEGPFVLLGK